MRNWPALILAPSLALAELTATYALVTPSCRHQTMTVLHAAAVLSLALALWMTLAAWHNAKRQALPVQGGSDVRTNRERFIALVATLTGALSSLTIVALWIPIWMMSPCAS